MISSVIAMPCPTPQYFGCPPKIFYKSMPMTGDINAAYHERIKKNNAQTTQKVSIGGILHIIIIILLQKLYVAPFKISN